MLAPNSGQLIIQDNTGFGYTQLAAVNQGYSAHSWYFVQAQWGTSGKIIATLFSSNGTTQLSTVTATDTNFTSGGIGFRTIAHAYFDTVTDTPGVNNFAIVGRPLQAPLGSGTIARVGTEFVLGTPSPAHLTSDAGYLNFKNVNQYFSAPKATDSSHLTPALVHKDHSLSTDILAGLLFGKEDGLD